MISMVRAQNQLISKHCCRKAIAQDCNLQSTQGYKTCSVWTEKLTAVSTHVASRASDTSLQLMVQRD
jgi:hypothetical protein